MESFYIVFYKCYLIYWSTVRFHGHAISCRSVPRADGPCLCTRGVHLQLQVIENPIQTGLNNEGRFWLPKLESPKVGWVSGLGWSKWLSDVSRILFPFLSALPSTASPSSMVEERSLPQKTLSLPLIGAVWWWSQQGKGPPLPHAYHPTETMWLWNAASSRRGRKAGDAANYCHHASVDGHYSCLQGFALTRT